MNTPKTDNQSYFVLPPVRIMLTMPDNVREVVDAEFARKLEKESEIYRRALEEISKNEGYNHQDWQYAVAVAAIQAAGKL